MNELRRTLSQMIWLQNENIRVGGGLFEIHGREYMNALEKAIQENITGAWDILRNGTDEEFLEILNNYEHVEEFVSDESLNEVMRIGKQRLVLTTMDREEFMRGLRIGFGSFFDQFWNEPEPATKARTFSQIMQA